jgi:hypothetical protein
MPMIKVPTDCVLMRLLILFIGMTTPFAVQTEFSKKSKNLTLLACPTTWLPRPSTLYQKLRNISTPEVYLPFDFCIELPECLFIFVQQQDCRV